MNALWLWLAPVIAIALLKSETRAAHARRHAAGSLHSLYTSAANSDTYPSFLRQFSNNVQPAVRESAQRNKRRKAIPCPKVFNPLCGILSGVKSTFLNECMMNAENIRTGADWEVFSDGICAEDYLNLRQKKANERKARFHNLQNDNIKANVGHTPSLTRSPFLIQSPVTNSYSIDKSKHYDVSTLGQRITKLEEFLEEFRSSIVFIDALPNPETEFKENFDDTNHIQKYWTLPSGPGLGAADYNCLSKDSSPIMPITNQYQAPSQVRSFHTPIHFERTLHYPFSMRSSHSTPYKMDVFTSYLSSNENLKIANNMNNIYSPLHTQNLCSPAENSFNPQPTDQSDNTSDSSSSSSSSEGESADISSSQEDTVSSNTEDLSEEPNASFQRNIHSKSSESRTIEIMSSAGNIEQDTPKLKTANTTENESSVQKKIAKTLVSNHEGSSKTKKSINMDNFDTVANKQERGHLSPVESEENGSSKTVFNAEETSNNTTATQLNINKPKNNEIVASDPTISNNEHSTDNGSSVTLESNIEKNEDVQEAVEASEAVEPKTFAGHAARTFFQKVVLNTTSNKEDEKLIAAGSKNVFRISSSNHLSVPEKSFDILFNSHASTSPTNIWAPYPYSSLNSPRPFYPISNPHTLAKEAQYGFTSKNDQLNIPETSSSEDSNTSSTSSETSDSIEDNNSGSSERSTSGEHIRSMLQSLNIPYRILHSPLNSLTTSDHINYTPHSSNNVVASRETYNQLHNDDPDLFLLYAPKETHLYNSNRQLQASKEIFNDMSNPIRLPTDNDAVVRECKYGLQPVCGVYRNKIQTFSNKCELILRSKLLKQTWSILNEGSCNYCNEKCTTEYDPICISRNGVQFTIANECCLRMSKCKDQHRDWQIIKQGECNALPTAPTNTVRKTHVVMSGDVTSMPKTADYLDNLMDLPLLSQQENQTEISLTTTATTTVAPIPFTSSALNIIINSYKPKTSLEHTVRDIGASAPTVPPKNQYQLESVKLEATSRNSVTQTNRLNSTSEQLERLVETISSSTITTEIPTTTPITTSIADPQTTTSTTTTTAAATTRMIPDIFHISSTTESSPQTTAIGEVKAIQSELITGIPRIRIFPTTQTTITIKESKIADYSTRQPDNSNPSDSHIMYLAKPKRK